MNLTLMADVLQYLRTDHRPLVYLFNIKNPTSKLTRMRIDLEGFDYDVVYIKGKVNVAADALSRIVTTSEKLKQVNILFANTRAMTRKKAQTTNTKEKDNNETKETDHLLIHETESPTQTKKMMKLSTSVVDNIMKCY